MMSTLGGSLRGSPDTCSSLSNKLLKSSEGDVWSTTHTVMLSLRAGSTSSTSCTNSGENEHNRLSNCGSDRVKANTQEHTNSSSVHSTVQLEAVVLYQTELYSKVFLLFCPPLRMCMCIYGWGWGHNNFHDHLQTWHWKDSGKKSIWSSFRAAIIPTQRCLLIREVMAWYFDL